jgi:prophage regulatory protein
MRILSFPDLRNKHGIPYTRQHLQRLERAGKWPRKVKIGAARIGWIEDEIVAHLRAMADARDAAKNHEAA